MSYLSIAISEFGTKRCCVVILSEANYLVELAQILRRVAPQDDSSYGQIAR